MRVKIFAVQAAPFLLSRACALRFCWADRFSKAIQIVLLSFLTLLPVSGRAEPMRFQMVSAGDATRCFGVCGTSIAAEGEITDATPQDFRAFLRMNAPERRGRFVVFINSPGGKIIAGIELGKIFRNAGVTAVVARVSGGAEATVFESSDGICFSACVYALMGARRRIAPRDSKIGIHRMFAYAGGALHFDNGEMAAMLRRYSQTMGVSPDLVVATEQGSSDAIRILTPAEIAKWNLASPGF